MTVHTTRHWYAAQSPRGFANEIVVHLFETRAERDAWIAATEDDNAHTDPYPVSARRAHRIVHYRGDAATESCNAMVRHVGGEEIPS